MTDDEPEEPVDWERYASAYDVLADNNPAYQSLVDEVTRLVSGLEPRAGGIIADLGAGSGNVSIRLAETHPHAQVVHVDSAAAMNDRARAKAAARSLSNYRIWTSDAWGAAFSPGELTGAVMVHALYTLPCAREYLGKVLEWLEPGGFLVACDPGRMMNVLDWSVFLLGHSLRTHGLRHTLSLFRNSRVAAAENRKIGREQRRRQYWTHDLHEFRSEIETSGFQVLEARVTYRGASDLVVARKPGLSMQLGDRGAGKVEARR